MSKSSVSWKELVGDVVQKLPREFTLSDVIEFKDYLAKHYPNNQFIEAKIRQTLQVLRDQGTLQFLGKGHYRRLDVAPAFSLLLDPALATAYKNRAQIARVVIETWAELNLYCLNCPADELSRLPPNSPLADFTCPRCESRYQLKAKDGRFSQMLTGAAYQPIIQAVRNRQLPDYVLAEYDTRLSAIWWVRAISGDAIGENRITPRKPLRLTARRAGWIGCNIDIHGLSAVDIVRPAPLEAHAVRLEWLRLSAKSEGI